MVSQIKEITSQEAWQMMKEDSAINFVDVRTPEEWRHIGKADLSELSKDVIYISWAFLPDMRVNKDFLLELENAVPAKDKPIFFMCKSGGRSALAAKCAIENGYSLCYNLSDGFEGKQHQEKETGWVNCCPFIKGVK